MKELMGSACNLSLVLVGDSLLPNVEVILIHSEPRYRFDPTGEIVKYRMTDAFRFSASPGELRTLAKSLGDSADAAERIAAIKGATPVADAPNNPEGTSS